jgi:hypothetical protein
MVAGDTVIVLPGTYSERVQVMNSGTVEAPLTFQAQGNVLTKGFTVGNSGTAVNYIAIKGFEITGTDCNWMNGNGVFVRGSGCLVEDNYIHSLAYAGVYLFVDPVDGAVTSDCTVRDNRIHRCSPGILARGRNHRIEGNEIWESVEFHASCSNPYSMPDGMNILGIGHRITGNYIHDTHYENNPDIGQKHIDGIQLWEVAEDIVIEGNFIEVLTVQALNETGQGIMLGNTGPDTYNNVIVRNNIIQAYRAINAWSCTNLSVANNVFTSQLSFPTQHFPFGVQFNRCPNGTIQNNAFYDIPGVHIDIADAQSQQGLSLGHNAVHRSDGGSPAGAPQPGDLWGVDPRFVDAALSDYHLRSDSPCIDAGAILSQVSDDYDGNYRPQGTTHDIGAYEYLGTSPSPTATPTTVAPTPTPTLAATFTPTPTATRTATSTPTQVPPTATPLPPTATPVPSPTVCRWRCRCASTARGTSTWTAVATYGAETSPILRAVGDIWVERASIVRIRILRWTLLGRSMTLCT